MTWGPGIALMWPDHFLRINVRPTEGRVGVDNGKEQWLLPCFVGPDMECRLRLRLEADQVLAEVSTDGEWWETVHTLPRSAFPGDPVALRVGKMASTGKPMDAGQASAVGTCAILGVRARQQTVAPTGRIGQGSVNDYPAQGTSRLKPAPQRPARPRRAPGTWLRSTLAPGT